MNITHGELCATVAGGALTELRPSGAENFAGAPVPLWEVTFRNRNGGKSRIQADAAGMAEETADSIVWEPELAPGCRCRIKVTVTPESDSLTLWQIAIEALPEEWSVFQVTFPCFDWQVEDSDRYRMVIPADRGIEKVNPLTRLPDRSELWVRRKFRERSYPNGFATMQCFGLIHDDRLLYFAAHDPEPVVKNFYFEPDPAAGVIRMRPTVKTALRYGEDYRSFPWALGFGRGDWFDVATRYRRFALTASWTREGALEDSDRTPRWYQDTPIVLLKDYRGELYDVEAFTRVAEYLQVPLLMHYYMWHIPAFDAGYPFFFPATPNFRNDMKLLQQAGIRVMPYINAYSADTETEEWKYLEPSAIRKNEGLELHAQVWSQNRALAAMCPVDPLWRRILSLVALRCVEMGVDGVYFDEVSCSPAHNCYADNHGHTPGDERAFIAGHRQLLRELRQEGRQINPDLILTTESCSEAYMDVLDGYLIGNNNAGDEVPLFEAVYHDYTIGFGQYIFCDELDDPRFAGAIIGKCARQFIYGAQFAWSRIPLLAIIEAAPEAAGFIKTLAHAKVRHADFLTRGKMLRPLCLDVPNLTQRWLKAWNDNTGEETILPTVLNSVWIRNDTAIAVVLVNIGAEPVTVTVELAAHPEDYPLPQRGSVRIHDHFQGECREAIAAGNSDGFSFRLEPLHCAVASIGSEKPYGVHGVQ